MRCVYIYRHSIVIYTTAAAMNKFDAVLWRITNKPVAAIQSKDEPYINAVCVDLAVIPFINTSKGVEDIKANDQQRSHDEYHVAFLFVDSDNGSDGVNNWLLPTYKKLLPRSITFVVCGGNFEWNPPQADSQFSVYSVIKKSTSTGYTCGTKQYANLGTLFSVVGLQLHKSWKTASELEHCMHVISSHARLKIKTPDTVVQKLIFPFDTRGDAECSNMCIINTEHATAIERAFKCAYFPMNGRLLSALPAALVDRNQIIMVVLPYTDLPTVKSKLITNDKYASDNGVDVITLILMTNPSISSYDALFQHTATKVNCVIASASKVTFDDWVAYAITAVGAVRMNRYKQQYGAVSNNECKSAIATTSQLLKASSITSKSMIAALNP